jgi:hypothetical protein
VGFIPVTPHIDAGIRIEPPVSLPRATGTTPAATAAPDPPLEPPVIRPGSHGLAVAPQAEIRLVAPAASSIGHPPSVCGAAAGGFPADHVEQVLHGHGDAVERRKVVVSDGLVGSIAGHVQRLVAMDLAERVRHRLPPLGQTQRVLDELHRRDGSLPNGPGHVEGRAHAREPTGPG